MTGPKLPSRGNLGEADRVDQTFPKLERLSTAVLVEIDEKWETENKAYIKWEQLDD